MLECFQPFSKLQYHSCELTSYVSSSLKGSNFSVVQDSSVKSMAPKATTGHFVLYSNTRAPQPMGTRYCNIEAFSMKRRRETEKESEIRNAIEVLSVVLKAKQPKSKDDEACQESAQVKIDAVYIPTKTFLSVCSFVLHVLDKIGPTMAVLRQDIHQNIQRIEALHDMQPEIYSNLVAMLSKEKNDGNARKSDSCCRAFVWLTRALDFTAALLRILSNEPGKTMEQAVEESYAATLKPWHGWISTAAYKVALRMVPDRKYLMTLLVNKDDNIETLTRDFQTLISLLVPLLDDAHNVLDGFDLTKLKSH